MNLRKSLILCTLVLCALCGCKKKASESQPAPAESAAPAAAAPKADAAKVDAAAPTDTAKADAAAPTDAAKADAAAPTDAAKADAAPADAAKGCSKWGSNDFFVDGKVLTFKHHEVTEAYDADDDEHTWECDKDGSCTRDLTNSLECRVKLVLAEADYCASEVQCTVTGKNAGGLNPADAVPHGLWAIDRNGVYLLPGYRIGTSSLQRRTTPADCSGLKYTDCSAGTLVNDYERFDDDMPTIPFVKSDVHESECDEEGIVCTDLEVKHQGTQWIANSSAEGGDSSESSFVWDDSRGLVTYKSEFSGGVNRTVEVTAM